MNNLHETDIDIWSAYNIGYTAITDGAGKIVGFVFYVNHGGSVWQCIGRYENEQFELLKALKLKFFSKIDPEHDCAMFELVNEWVANGVNTL